MLTEKEKRVLELRNKGHKQSLIASKLKISQSAVSSFESNALKKIREAAETLEYTKKLKIEYGKNQ